MGRDGHTCNYGAMDDAAAVIVIGDTDLELVRDSGGANAVAFTVFHRARDRHRHSRVRPPLGWPRKFHDLFLCRSNRQSKVQLPLDWLMELYDPLLSFKPKINFIAPRFKTSQYFHRFGLATKIYNFSGSAWLLHLPVILETINFCFRITVSLSFWRRDMWQWMLATVFFVSCLN